MNWPQYYILFEGGRRRQSTGQRKESKFGNEENQRPRNDFLSSKSKRIIATVEKCRVDFSDQVVFDGSVFLLRPPEINEPGPTKPADSIVQVEGNGMQVEGNGMAAPIALKCTPDGAASYQVASPGLPRLRASRRERI